MRKVAADSPQEWVVVGGGIHGVHIALRLIAEGGVDPEQLCLVDPAQELLARWRSNTEVMGMAYLRSPAVHHLGPEHLSLLRYAGKRRERSAGLFALPYDRPALGLFNDHCAHLIRVFDLERRHRRARALECSIEAEQVRVRLSDGERIAARQVVLALGASEQPHWPDWAPREEPLVQHVLAPDFSAWPEDEAESVAVVGGGISAGHVAVRLAAAGHSVQLVTRHELREHQFDSDPGWLGPKYMTRYQQTRDYVQRRATIDRARHRGSLTPELRRALRIRQQRGEIRWHQAEVEGAQPLSHGVRLSLRGAAPLEVDRALLATGFTTARPGGRLVDEMIRSADLPCAPCGYPIVDTSLRWHPRVRVSGPLAELELGPSARTIAGARRAADRIVPSQRIR